MLVWYDETEKLKLGLKTIFGSAISGDSSYNCFLYYFCSRICVRNLKGLRHLLRTSHNDPLRVRWCCWCSFCIKGVSSLFGSDLGA